MPGSSNSPALFPERPVAAGKFFRRCGETWTMHGLTYGPFSGPDGLPDPEQAARDLALMSDWGANTIRLYAPPPDWFLDLCALYEIGVVCGVAWMDHVDFLNTPATRKAAIRAVSETARRLAPRREIVALLVGNEINASLVRWLGPKRVQHFLESLIEAAHEAAPGLLTGYANYPSTEFIQPENADFTAFNLYLESPGALDQYLARLQNIAGDHPLIISEFGVDVKSAGAEKQAEILTWQQNIARQHGVAGNLLFAFTDEWHRGGQDVTGWKFGLTDRLRQPRPAWQALAGGPPPLSRILPPYPPRVSVIVCTRNGTRTLRECLESLQRLDYPNYEIILVDDGSGPGVAAIAAGFPGVRCVRQEPLGLGVARNTGAAAASGSIFAYTDDDCVADPAWLTYLIRPFSRPEVGAAGGPNIPPPPVNRSQACVIATPGGPAHVLFTDTTAEHIPGCNMAIRREAFHALGGFQPKYHAAGDDVDFCWRLLEAGGVIAFEAAAMVWHYRRFNVWAFFKQQAGYGKAEALLTARHSSRFGRLGGARWQGMVYHPALRRLTHHASRIYSGVFGCAPYQTIYENRLSEISWLITGLPWWLLTAAAAAGGFWQPFLFRAAALMAAAPLAYTLFEACRLPLARSWSGLPSRLLLWFLLLAQPLVRGTVRFLWNLRLGSAPSGPWLTRTPDQRHPSGFYKRVAGLELWSERGLDRHRLLEVFTAHLREKQIPLQIDDGWRDWDLETTPDEWWRVRFTTVTEYHSSRKCLTRVRIASRASRKTVAFVAIAAALAAILVFPLHLHPLWIIGGLFVASLIFESRHHTAVARAAKMVLAAARPAGFEPVVAAPQARH